jgi:hypothetical protein
MIPFALPNIDASVLTVDTTARTLKELIEIAGAVPFNLPPNLDAIDLNVSGEIRVASDGNIPTASKGFKLSQGVYRLRGVNLNELRMIAASNTDVDIQIGQSSPGEQDTSSSANTNPTFGDVLITGNLTVQGNTSVGPITADSLDVTGNISTTGGNLRVRNGGFIQGRNAADTAWLDLIEMRSTNRVRIPSTSGAAAWEVAAPLWFIGTGGTTANQFSIGRLDGTGNGGYNVETGARHTFSINNVNQAHIEPAKILLAPTPTTTLGNNDWGLVKGSTVMFLNSPTETRITTGGNQRITVDSDGTRVHQVIRASTGETNINGAVSIGNNMYRSLTVTGNVTSMTLPTLPSSNSAKLTIHFRQDGTGGHSVVFPAITYIGSAPVMPSTAGESIVVEFFWTGGAWRGYVLATD